MEKRILFFFIILISVTGCHTAEDYFSSGLDLSASGNFQSAIKKFDQAILENPYFKDSYIHKGICYENLNKHDSAIQTYADLLELYPANTAANYYSGVCNYRIQKYSDAVGFYDRALKSKGGFDISDTDNIQSVLDLNKDNFESESAEYDIPIREILYDRAMAYYKTGQLQKAHSDFSNCITLEYNTGNSYYMIGMCHLAKKQHRYAREAFMLASQFGSPLAKKRLKFM